MIWKTPQHFDRPPIGRALGLSVSVIGFVSMSFPAHANHQPLPTGCPAPEALRIDTSRHASADSRYKSLVTVRETLEPRRYRHNITNGCGRDLDRGSAKERACEQPGHVLRAETAAYGKQHAEQKSMLLADLTAAIAANQAYLQGLRAELARVPKTHAQWARDMEDWVALGDKARKDARTAAFSAAFGLVIDRLQQGIQATRAVREQDVAGFKAWVERDGINVISEHGLRSAKTQLHLVQTWGDLIAVVQYIHNQHTHFFKTAEMLKNEERWQAAAQALIEVLARLGSRNPAIAAVKNTAELWIDVGYGWSAALVMRNRLTEIINLEERHYEVVKRISRDYIDRYKAHAALLAARDAINAGSCPL